MSDGRKFEFNWPWFGNRHIIDFLQGSILSRELSHFYIFSGLPDLGKSALALAFSASLLCRNFADGQGLLPCGSCPSCLEVKKAAHSDLTFLRLAEEKKNISVEQVRNFIRLMSLGSFASGFKIGLVKNAESLSLEAANCLLKTLEEPKPGVVIILLTSHLEQLPATILSRGQILLFRPAAREQVYDYLVNEHKLTRDFARVLSRISSGRPALAAKLANDPGFFAGRKKIILTLIKMMSDNISGRFQAIEEIIKQEPGSAVETLEVWQTITRDLLLMRLNLEELTANELALNELREVNLPIAGLLNLQEKIKEGMKYLAANANPRTVLENISLQT